MVNVKISLMASGYCKQLESISIQGGRWKNAPFPAIFSLIEHPTKGLILFDTGYAEHFFTATQAFPNRLYRWITPVTLDEDQSALSQIQKRGYKAGDVKHVICSHFHADHYAGLRDFGQAEIICTMDAYAYIRQLKGWRAVKNGFLPELLPDDIEKRLKLIDSHNKIPLSYNYSPFEFGYDILGDQSLIGVDIPGHAPGQMGLFLNDKDKGSFFLAADACWSSKAFRENKLPHNLANIIIWNTEQYRKSFQAIHTLHQRCPELQIIPSHCQEVWKEIKQ